MIHEKYMLETDDDNAIGFLKYGDKYFEYLAPFFALDFPELKDEDFETFIEWADEKAPIIHKTECEYEFPIAYWDNKYLSEISVPEQLKPIFKALIKYGKQYNKELSDQRKVIPCLKLWIPKPP